MFKATLTDPNILINSISTIAELIDEGLFRISKEGISLIAADRAIVAVVDFNLASSAFENYELDEGKSIGLNITNLLSVLKRATGSKKLSLYLQDSRLEIIIENGVREGLLYHFWSLAKRKFRP